jgi:hypothetical protein
MDNMHLIETYRAQYDTLGNVLYDCVIKEIEIKARAILKRNPKRLGEFIMAMGMASLDVPDRSGHSYMQDAIERDEFAQFKGGAELWDFIQEYDEIFKVKGEPMRFTAHGPKITDW